jgi:predicted acetyltransferase
MNIKKLKNEDEVFLKLLQTYEREFSAITKKTPTADGCFALDFDRSKTDNYLLYESDLAIGFCVKGNSNNRHDIFEFYITPNKRGDNKGCGFAKSIFEIYKGEWQVRQIEGADKAISFWRKAISEFTDGQYEEAVVEDTFWGKVTRQIFDSK